VSNIADPWDLVECQKCSSTQDEERMILCDVCDGGYHFYCAEPKLKKVPDGDWICQSCVALKTGKKRRRRRTQAEMLLERASAAAVTSSKGDSGVSCSGVVKGEGAAPDKTEAQETPWDETTCGKCGSAEDEEHMILCDMCDSGFHLDCAEPKLKQIPEGDWICKDCRKSKKKQKRPVTSAASIASAAEARSMDAKSDDGGSSSKGARKRPQGDGEHCSSNPWAAVECHACFSAEGEDSMILCDVCDGGYHLDCVVPKLKKVPTGDWICPECAGQKKGKKKNADDRRGRASCHGKMKHDGNDTSASSAENTHAGDGSNPWDLIECQHCGSAEGEGRMILCDICDGGFHLECTDPQLKDIPDGEWICKDCSRARKRAQSKKEQEKKYKEFQERVNSAAPKRR